MQNNRRIIKELREAPTCWEIGEIPENKFGGLAIKRNGHHESLLRAYRILRYVRELLERGTPSATILEILDEVEAPNDTPPYDMHKGE